MEKLGMGFFIVRVLWCMVVNSVSNSQRHFENSAGNGIYVNFLQFWNLASEYSPDDEEYEDHIHIIHSALEVK
jgi:hypothetical protein